MTRSDAELRAEAERVVTAIESEMKILAADRAAIVDAVTLDLADKDRGARLEDRLLKIEAQVQALATLVAALTDAMGASDPPVQ